MKYPTVPGKCPMCLTPIFSGSTRLQNHCQFDVLMSNQNITRIGMCKDCFISASDEDIIEIFLGLKQYWRETQFDIDEDVILTRISRETVWPE